MPAEPERQPRGGGIAAPESAFGDETAAQPAQGGSPHTAGVRPSKPPGGSRRSGGAMIRARPAPVTSKELRILRAELESRLRRTSARGTPMR